MDVACLGYALSAVTWLVLAVTFISEVNCYVPKRTWLLRFPILFIFAGEIAKLRCPFPGLTAALQLGSLVMATCTCDERNACALGTPTDLGHSCARIYCGQHNIIGAAMCMFGIA